MGKVETIALLALPLIGSWLGGFFGAYFKEKGKNLATHEDIDHLVDQVRAVTSATKEIETKISDQVWDRQRQWELRRDILLNFARAMRDFDLSALKLGIALKIYNSLSNELKPTRQKNRDDALKTWNDASHEFERHAYLATLVVGDASREEIGKMSWLVRNISNDLLSQKDPDAHVKRNPELALQITVVGNVIRRELGLPPTA